MPDFEESQQTIIDTDRGTLTIESEVTDKDLIPLVRQINELFKDLDKIFQREFKGIQGSPELILINDDDLALFSNKDNKDGDGCRANTTSYYIRNGSIFLNIKKLNPYLEDNGDGGFKINQDGIFMLKTKLVTEFINHYSIRLDDKTSRVSSLGINWETSFEGAAQINAVRSKERKPIKRVIRFDPKPSGMAISNIDTVAKKEDLHATILLRVLASSYVLYSICGKSEAERIGIMMSTPSIPLDMISLDEITQEMLLYKLKIKDIFEALTPYTDNPKLKQVTGTSSTKLRSLKAFAETIFGKDTKKQINAIHFFAILTSGKTLDFEGYNIADEG